MTDAATIVGRESELATLDAFLTNAAAEAAVVVLEGEAGSGKTTLWTYAVEAAARSGSTVLAARPAEAETGFAYAGLSDLLAPRLGELDDLPPPLRRALELAFLIADAGDDRAEEHAVASATLAAVRALASRRPLLVAVDDVQWLDASSRRALVFAFRRLRHERVGVLLATRDAVPIRRELPPSAEVHALRPLSVGAIGKIVRSRLGGDVSRAAVRRVSDVARGNPFYALELAAAVQRDAGHGADLTIPPSLHELVRDRVERLSGACLEVCFAVALAAQPTEALIESALGPGAVAELERAAALGVLDLAHERLRFTHPLLGSAIALRSSRRRRAEVHRMLAGVVADDEQRARHLAAATAAPNEDVAREVAQGGERAAQRGAPSAAAELLEEAARLTPSELGDEAVARAAAAAHYRFLSGETARAAELFEGIVAMMPPGLGRARLARPLARVRAARGAWSDAAEVLRKARAEAGEDATVLGRIENDLAIALVQDGFLSKAFEHATAALRAAESSGDTALLDDARLNITEIEFQRGRADPVEATAVFEALRHGVEERPEQLLPRHLSFITWAKYTDRFDDARTAIRELVDELTARGREGLLPQVLFQSAELECWAGDLDAAGPLAEAARESYEQADQPWMEPRALYVEGLLHAIRGDRGSARDSGARGLRLAERARDRRSVIRHLAMLGFSELTHDDPDAAHRHLERADEIARRAGYGEPGMFRKDGDAIEALIRLGLHDRARERLNQLESAGRRLRRASALSVAGRCRGLLAVAEGRPELAAQLLERALRGSWPQPLERARTLLAYGQVLRRQQRRRQAHETLERALAIFDRVGAQVYVERTRSELARIGGRAVAAGDALSETERRIAELVAQGRSNREVAAALSLSPKTVEWNLSKVYAKLGVRSRAELAARRD